MMHSLRLTDRFYISANDYTATRDIRLSLGNSGLSPMPVSSATSVILAKARVVVQGCTVHGNKGCHPSQRACRPLKWIPASALASCFALPSASMQSYAGMTTKDLNLPALKLTQIYHPGIVYNGFWVKPGMSIRLVHAELF